MPSIADAKGVLVFGTDTGNTEEAGEKICEQLAAMGCKLEMLDVADLEPADLETYDFMILGIPTWDFGGIQEDWEEFEEQLLTIDMSKKIIAMYGLGDQRGYGDYFLDAMGWLNERVLKMGATVIGAWSTEGYDFEASLAANDDKTQFCGLGLDEDQQIELSDERIEQWAKKVAEEYQAL